MRRNNEVGTVRQTPAQIHYSATQAMGAGLLRQKTCPSLAAGVWRGSGVERAAQRAHRDVACDCHESQCATHSRMLHRKNVMMLCEAGFSLLAMLCDMCTNVTVTATRADHLVQQCWVTVLIP
jgi:hypothetical protein